MSVSKWANAPLSLLCDILKTGDSINAVYKKEHFDGLAEGYPYIATKDVGFDTVVDYENGVKIPFEGTNFVKAPKGSILLCIEGGSSGRKVGITNQVVCYGNKLCCFYTKAISQRYLFYYLQSPLFQALFIDKQKAERKSVTTTQINEFSVMLPPLAEQHRIVAKIDTLFSELDKGVEVLQTVRQQLRTYRQAVLKWAFEGIETFTKLGDLYSMSPQNGLYVPATAYGSGIPILRIDGFYDGRISYDYKFKRVEIEQGMTESYALLIGDLVINRVNSMPYLGKCALVTSLHEPTVFESNMMRLRLDTALCDLRYVTYFLCSEKGKQELKKNAKQAVNQASINQKDVANVDIPIPKKSTQTEIVSAIESRLSVCDKLEQLIDENLAKAQSLRQSILKKAFAGELVPQDPNDEPAEKLLERIKAAKATAATKTTSARRKRK